MDKTEREDGHAAKGGGSACYAEDMIGKERQ